MDTGAIVIWGVIAVVFFVIELITVSMVSIWFVAGAAVALIASLLGAPLWLQIVLFILVSGLCFLLLYPRLKKSVQKRREPTNADMVLGQTCVVTQRIDNIAGTGTVTVGGKTWTARTLDGSPAEEGSLVKAVEIRGVKLIVSQA